jgi:hypothetical protein
MEHEKSSRAKPREIELSRPEANDAYIAAYIAASGTAVSSHQMARRARINKTRVAGTSIGAYRRCL